MKLIRTVPLAAQVVLLLVVKGLAADSETSYQTTFGQAERAALATSGTKDDIELAIKLMAGADSVRNDDAYAMLLREKAFELAVKDVAGLPTAVSAANSLIKADPKGHSSYRSKLLESCRILYSKATRADKAKAGAIYLDQLMGEADRIVASNNRDDAEAVYRQALIVGTAVHSSKTAEIRTRLKEFEDRKAAQMRINRLSDRLKKDPQNKALARDLMIGCITELDDPSRAAPYAVLMGDKESEELIEIAIKARSEGPAGLSTAEAIRLANWYNSVSEQSPAASKASVLSRALNLYQTASSDNALSDADRLHAETAAAEIEKKIRKLRPDLPGLDLIALIDAKRDLIKFVGQDHVLAKKEEYGSIQFPYLPPDEYDYEIVFTKLSGSAGVHQICYHPKTKTSFRWVWGEAGAPGLELVNGKAAVVDSVAIRDATIQNGRKYRALIKVRESHVQVLLDGKLIFDFATDYRNLKPVTLLPETGRLGLAAVVPVTVEAAEVREVSGKGKIVK